MTSRKGGFPSFLVGLVAGALGGIALGRRLSSERRVPNLDVWQAAMAEERGQMESARLVARVRTRYGELFAARPHFAGQALRLHLEEAILPGLALYQVLLEERDDPEAALDEVQALFRAAYARFGKGVSLLRHLPGQFRLFRWLARRLLIVGFPPQGWDVAWIQDDDHALAFDMRSCFYLDVLSDYGAPELTPLYCWVDDLMYESLPPGISWERTKTLGRGDDCCDFRWVSRQPEA